MSAMLPALGSLLCAMLAAIGLALAATPRFAQCRRRWAPRGLQPS
jgi:hypothetical protein